MVVTVLHVVAGVVILAAVAFAIRVRSSSRAVVRNMQAVLKEADSVNMESKRLVKHSESIRDCLETLLRESNSTKAFEEVSARCCRTLGLDAMHVVDFSDPSTMEDRLSDIYAVARRARRYSRIPMTSASSPRPKRSRRSATISEATPSSRSSCCRFR